MTPSQPLRRTLLALALLLAFTLSMTRSVLAQEVQPTAPASAGDSVTQNDVNDVARELWCPLCSGVRLDACELKACDQMKDMIQVKLGEGESVQSIKDYFVQQYGPQVLGEPPFQGFFWLAWLLPVAALIGGGVFLYTRARKMSAQSEAASAGDAAHADSVASAKTVASDAATSEYAKRLDEELKQNE
jgi:cytochrome c-type biogenesis protein CcmH